MGFDNNANDKNNTCVAPRGYVADATDCDDTTSTNTKLCDSVDSDCDTTTDYYLPGDIILFPRYPLVTQESEYVVSFKMDKIENNYKITRREKRTLQDSGMEWAIDLWQQTLNRTKIGSAGWRRDAFLEFLRVNAIMGPPIVKGDPNKAIRAPQGFAGSPFARMLSMSRTWGIVPTGVNPWEGAAWTYKNGGGDMTRLQAKAMALDMSEAAKLDERPLPGQRPQTTSFTVDTFLRYILT